MTVHPHPSVSAHEAKYNLWRQGPTRILAGKHCIICQPLGPRSSNLMLDKLLFIPQSPTHFAAFSWQSHNSPSPSLCSALCSIPLLLQCCLLLFCLCSFPMSRRMLGISFSGSPTPQSTRSPLWRASLARSLFLCLSGTAWGQPSAASLWTPPGL